MNLGDNRREGKRLARELIKFAQREMKRKYGGLGRLPSTAHGAPGDEALVVNDRTLAAALYIHPATLSHLLNPDEPHLRPSLDQIKTIVAKLEMTDTQRSNLLIWYGYEAGVPIPAAAAAPAPTPRAAVPLMPASAHTGAAATPTNLPEWSTSFVGRGWVLDRLHEDLTGARLLTVRGMGGCGKTRLCLEYARRVLAQYPDGVWFVDLARLAPGDDALVPSALAAILKVREQPKATLTDSIVRHLRSHRALIILDNCEHLINGSAALADALIAGAERVDVIATSRRVLAVAGEREFALRALDVPTEQGPYDPATAGAVEAVRLFVDRVRMIRPQFALSRDNIAAIVRICRRLEGIPLALELAATRVRIHSPAQLADLLDDRFAALGRPQPAAYPRQETLDAILDWSYTLLTEDEQRLLRRLAVFAGGWRLCHAEQICAGDGLAPEAVAGLLEDLIDRSLVQADSRGSEEVRFQMLDTVRDYASGKLLSSPDAPTLIRRHREWFASYVQPMEERLNGPEQGRFLAELAHEVENVRAALRSAADAGDAEAELQIGAGMWKYWHLSGAYRAGRDALTAVLAHADAAPPLPRAKVLSAASILASELGDLREARALTEQSKAIREQAGDAEGVARSLLVLGRLARMQGDWDSASAYWQESLAVHERLESWDGYADALINLGFAAAKRGAFSLARQRFTQGKEILRNRDPIRYAMALNNEGDAALEQGDYTAARALHGQSLELARGHDKPVPWLVAAEYLALGRIAYLTGDSALGHSLLNQSLHLRRESSDRAGVAACQRHLAAIDARRGEFADAREQCDASLAITRAAGDHEGTADALLTLAFIAAREGNDARARALLHEAVTLCRKADYRLGLIAAIEAVARLAAGEDRAEPAARLLGATAAARDEMGTPLPPIDRDEAAATATRLLARLGDDAYTHATTEGRALSLHDAAQCALTLV